MVQTETVELKARDGYPLKSIHTPPRAESTRGRIIIASATAVPQRFYQKLATFLSERGYAVWTLDYRGIGLSKPPSLVGFDMDYLDWAKLDLTCLVDHVANGGNQPIFMIGHSYGGHAIGLIDRPERIKAFVTFGIGAGWSGWMPLFERIRVNVLWNIVGPALVLSKGYLAWSVLRMGEDLPRGVFLQWKRWASYPHYFFDDPSMKHLAPLYERIRAPILAINSVDDKWATPRSRDAFLSAFKNANIVRRDIQPSDLGLKGIGHFNYFKSDASPLWEQALEFLEDQ